MKKIFSIFLFLFFICSFSFAVSTPTGWTDDLEAAKKQAINENKILLVNFTGTDWCKWCKVLEKEVLSQKKFTSEAKKNFILVFIDVPNDQNRLSPLGKKQNKKIVDLYGIKSFPTIALMDPSGIILDRAGYQAGGPQKYINMLNGKLSSLKEKINDFRKIHNAKGINKAKQIDQWLSNKNITEKKIAVSWINEMLEIDAKYSLGLKKKYAYFTDFIPLEETVSIFLTNFFTHRKQFLTSIPQNKKQDKTFIESKVKEFYKEWDPKFEEIRNKINQTKIKTGNNIDPKLFSELLSKIDFLQNRPSK